MHLLVYPENNIQLAACSFYTFDVKLPLTGLIIVYIM